MPGLLEHSQADVIRQLLVDLSLGTDPDQSAPWPVRSFRESDYPSNHVTVYNTGGVLGLREHVTGERSEFNGIQIRVRSERPEEGFAKCNAIAVALDTVRLKVVHIGGANYRVYSVTRTSDVLSLGHDLPSSKRSVFTVNATVSLRRV